MSGFQPYVKLLGQMDYRKEAWKTSRPKFTEENLHFDKIEEMDLSLNSMLVYTFEMRSSVIVRDLIFSLRPLEGWALSTRSMPINRDTLKVSSEFENSDAEEKVERMFQLLESGKSRDQARGVLPAALSTTYTFTMDFRVLMGFCKAMEKLSKEIFDLYCIHMLIATNNVERYKTTTVKNALEFNVIKAREKINGISGAGNYIIGHYEMKLALASQFLRQHYSKVKIGFWNILENTNYLYIDIDQNTPIDVSFCIDRTAYHHLMSMRAHWVIDWSEDMWGGIVGDYVKDMWPHEFWAFLPNGGGKEDPYWADVYNRVIGEDPGMPCPIMCEWPLMLDLKEREVGGSILMDKYRELVENGFIKNNPKNEHRIKALQCRGDLS